MSYLEQLRISQSLINNDFKLKLKNAQRSVNAAYLVWGMRRRLSMEDREKLVSYDLELEDTMIRSKDPKELITAVSKWEQATLEFFRKIVLRGPEQNLP